MTEPRVSFIYLSEEEAARRLGISVDHLKGLREAHGIPFTLVNGTPMYADDHVSFVAETRRMAGLGS